MGTEPAGVAALRESASNKASAAQIGLFSELMASRAPHLERFAASLKLGERMGDDIAEEIEEVLASVMLQSELTEDGELTDRGKEIDDLIGVCRQLAASFEDPDG